MNVYIPVVIIVCLYRNYLTKVMNQFDLEFKKLSPAIGDMQSSMRLRVTVYFLSIFWDCKKARLILPGYFMNFFRHEKF